LIRFEKVNDKLVELFIVEPVVMVGPMSSIAESKVQLDEGVSRLERLVKNVTYLHSCIGN